MDFLSKKGVNASLYKSMGSKTTTATFIKNVFLCVFHAGMHARLE